MCMRTISSLLIEVGNKITKAMTIYYVSETQYPAVCSHWLKVNQEGGLGVNTGVDPKEWQLDVGQTTTFFTGSFRRGLIGTPLQLPQYYLR